FVGHNANDGPFRVCRCTVLRRERPARATPTPGPAKDMTTIKETATLYTQAGLHILPVKGDGSKEIALPTWKEYQSRPARQDEIDQWFGSEADRGIAIAAANGLEILDFDRPGLFDQFEP